MQTAFNLGRDKSNTSQFGEGGIAWLPLSLKEINRLYFLGKGDAFILLGFMENVRRVSCSLREKESGCPLVWDMKRNGFLLSLE